ncbi:hypothetical protein NKG94_49485 [Micromonospora sp. M12]
MGILLPQQQQQQQLLLLLLLLLRVPAAAASPSPVTRRSRARPALTTSPRSATSVKLLPDEPLRQQFHRKCGS